MKAKRSILYTLVLTLLVTSFGFNLSSATPVGAVSAVAARCSSVQTVAHRGLAGRRSTENTLAAFQNAYNRGSRTIETDLRVTSDDQWAVMHDATTGRTTKGTNYHVANLRLAQVENLTTNDGRKGGVPSLADALWFLKNRPTAKMHLEIKTERAKDAALNRILAQLTYYGVQNRVVVTSFHGPTLSRIRALDPTKKLETGIISSGAISAARAKVYGNHATINYRAVSRAYVAGMHRADIKVYAWTVDTKSAWKRMVLAGVDGITTDKTPKVNQYCRAARR